jgi:hypothetical protein
MQIHILLLVDSQYTLSTCFPTKEINVGAIMMVHYVILLFSKITYTRVVTTMSGCYFVNLNGSYSGQSRIFARFQHPRIIFLLYFGVPELMGNSQM